MGSAFGWVKEDLNKIIAAGDAVRELHAQRNSEAQGADGLFGDMQGIPQVQIEDAFDYLTNTEITYAYTILGEEIAIELVNIDQGYTFTVNGVNYKVNFIAGGGLTDEFRLLDADVKQIPGEYQSRLDDLIGKLQPYKVEEQ